MDKAFLQELAATIKSGLIEAFADFLVKDQPFKIGQPYYFRCVTYHYVGVVTKVGPYEIVIKNPVWVADSGKWDRAYATGELTDYMYGPDHLILGRLSIVDAGPWTAPMPKNLGLSPK